MIRLSCKNLLNFWLIFGKTRLHYLIYPSLRPNPSTYTKESRYPQSRLHANREKGMQLGIGRLRKDSVFDIYYLALARNTIRGAVLNAELLVEKGYL